MSGSSPPAKRPKRGFRRPGRAPLDDLQPPPPLASASSAQGHSPDPPTSLRASGSGIPFTEFNTRPTTREKNERKAAEKRDREAIDLTSPSPDPENLPLQVKYDNLLAIQIRMQGKMEEKDAKIAGFDQRFTTARRINAKQEARISELEDESELNMKIVLQSEEIVELKVKIEEQEVKLADRDEEVRRQTDLADQYIALNQRLLGL